MPPPVALVPIRLAIFTVSTFLSLLRSRSSIRLLWAYTINVQGLDHLVIFLGLQFVISLFLWSWSCLYHLVVVMIF
jgi:hypothetical protein